MTTKRRNIGREMLTVLGIFIGVLMLSFWTLGGGLTFFVGLALVGTYFGYCRAHDLSGAVNDALPAMPAMFGLLLVKAVLLTKGWFFPLLVAIPFTGFLIGRWIGNREVVATSIAARITGEYRKFPRFIRESYASLYGKPGVYEEDKWATIQQMIGQMGGLHMPPIPRGSSIITNRGKTIQ